MGTVPGALIAASVAFTVSLAFVPLAVRLGRHRRWLDLPDGRRHHGGAVPRTGGIAVAAGLAAGCLVALALGEFRPYSADLDGALPFIAGTAIVFAIGLLDDVRGSSVVSKLLAQSVAASLIVAAGHSIEFVRTPFGVFEVWEGPIPGAAAAILAVVWLVGITNAMNFMDGLDGLAGGIGGIIAGSLAVFAGLRGDSASMCVALILCGACVGFLPYNWRPARIFLGDAGSLTIGFVLAWLSLTTSLKANTVAAVFLPFLVLGVPAFDALLVMRARYREGSERRLPSRVQRMFQGDRQHLHHLILAVADHRVVLLTIYGFVGLFCILAQIAVFRSNWGLAAATLGAEFLLVMLVRSAIRRLAAGDLAGWIRSDILGRRGE